MSVSESVIIFEKSLNGHNSANFEATTSRFCMVIDLNEMYRIMMRMMMMTMMMVMMMMISVLGVVETKCSVACG